MNQIRHNIFSLLISSIIINAQESILLQKNERADHLTIQSIYRIVDGYLGVGDIFKNKKKTAGESLTVTKSAPTMYFLPYFCLLEARNKTRNKHLTSALPLSTSCLLSEAIP